MSFNLQLEVNVSPILVGMEEHATTQDKVMNAHAQEDSEEKTAKVINLRSTLITYYYFEAVSSSLPTSQYMHQGLAMNICISLEAMSSCFVPSLTHQHCLAKSIQRCTLREVFLTAHPQACVQNRPTENLSLNVKLNKACCICIVSKCIYGNYVCMGINSLYQ